MRLPFTSNAFICALFVLVIHQLTEQERKIALRNVFRVLKSGGFLIIKTCSHNDLRERPFNDIFPSSLPLNLRRYPSVESLTSNLESVGFHVVNIIPTFTEQELKIPDFFSSIELKHNSTLALLPEDEFIDGVMRLKDLLKKEATIKVPHHHTVFVCAKGMVHNE